MNDRQPFEDEETVERYLAAVPQPETAYREQLHTRLLSAPSPNGRNRTTTIRRRVSVGGVMGAIIAVLVVLFGPIAFPGSTSVSPQEALARAIRMLDHPVPYRGASELTFVQDRLRHRDTSVWTVRDATHWRVVLKTRDAAGISQKSIVVARGHSAVWTNVTSGRVVHMTIKNSQMGAAVLGMFQGQEGADGQTLKQYLARLNSRSSGMHGRYIGAGTVLHRRADVIDLWPVVETESNPCGSAGGCSHVAKAYGHARLWFDHTSGMLLEMRQWGVPASVTDAPHNLVYRVTSLSFGA